MARKKRVAGEQPEEVREDGKVGRMVYLRPAQWAAIDNIAKRTSTIFDDVIYAIISRHERPQ